MVCDQSPLAQEDFVRDCQKLTDPLLLMSFVISLMPSTKSVEKRSLQMYPLCPTSFPKTRSMKDLFLRTRPL